mmetsp:Transcript_32152/g.80922  ORF Transcript_32152/g.80922 Transcript_32152/m.80922 type:complete len:469 (-) Transcript_32152:26-1432(-)
MSWVCADISEEPNGEESAHQLAEALPPHAAATDHVPANPKPEPEQRAEWVLQLCDRLYFTMHKDEAETISRIRKYPSLFYFSNPLSEMYQPFCADFGPVSASIVCQFCEDMRERVADTRIGHRNLVFYTYMGDTQGVANTVFLLAAYLMLDVGLSPDEAAHKFEGLTLPLFRDATYTVPTYFLSGLDVLKGMQRARMVGWFDHLTFDIDTYEDDYDMLVDMVHVSPKFAAFSAPRRGQCGPLTERLRATGVTDVVKLNSNADYPAETFVEQGMTMHDLCFDDCTCPAPSVVRRFLDICEAAEGVVGVHCLAGLGRTGTLIACYMIKHHGFTAKEVIGYLRVMRPGSVIGRQQHYLELVAMSKWDGNTPVLCGEATSGTGSPTAAAAGAPEAGGEGCKRTDSGGAYPEGPLENTSHADDWSHQTLGDQKMAEEVAQAVYRKRFLQEASNGDAAMEEEGLEPHLAEGCGA